MIVSDAALERAAFVRFARRAGWSVGEAADVEAALDALAAFLPEVVVVDGRLPPDGGLPLVSRLRSAPPQPAVLVIVSFEERELLRAARERGALGAVARPLLPSQIAEQLRRAARTPGTGRE